MRRERSKLLQRAGTRQTQANIAKAGRGWVVSLGTGEAASSDGIQRGVAFRRAGNPVRQLSWSSRDEIEALLLTPHQPKNSGAPQRSKLVYEYNTNMRGRTWFPLRPRPRGADRPISLRGASRPGPMHIRIRNQVMTSETDCIANLEAASVPRSTFLRLWTSALSSGAQAG